MDFEHIVIYKGTDYHSAFPGIIRLDNGDLVTVFRQAPARPPDDREAERGSSLTHRHVDNGSRIAMVRSTDDGRTWDPDTLVVIDAADGTNDLNMGMVSQVSSGELIMNNHRWHVGISDEEAANLGDSRMDISRAAGGEWTRVVFDSLYFARSSDGGATWGEPYPVSVSGFEYRAHTGKDGILELDDGTWLLPFHGMAAGDVQDRMFVARSYDQGRTWGQPSTVAYDPERTIGFHEPPLLRLPSGRLLTVIRTNDADGYLYQAYSDNDGWTWEGLQRTPMWGHPCNVMSMPDGRVLCTYGYRREPFGVRACFSSDEGETWDIANEVVIRDDGIHTDLGYAASILLNDGSILSTYYFHGEDGIRYIGGSIWQG